MPFCIFFFLFIENGCLVHSGKTGFLSLIIIFVAAVSLYVTRGSCGFEGIFAFVYMPPVLEEASTLLHGVAELQAVAC